MATTKKNTGRITLRTVLEHVQVNGIRLVSLEKEMKKEFKAVYEKMDAGFKEVHQKIDASTRRLSTQIHNIDLRLDDVEIKELPKLKKAVAAR